MPKGAFLMRRTSLPGIEAVEADSNHRFPKHTHDQFGIGVILRGAQTSLSGRGMVDAGLGNVITVNPGEVHDGLPIGDRGRAWRMLYFDPAIVLDALSDIFDEKGVQEFHHPVLVDGMAATQFLTLFALATSGQPDITLAQQSRLFLLIQSLVSGVQASVGVPDALRRVRALLDDLPADDVTLADLAKVSGLSRFQVLRSFSRLTGLSPHAYLMQRRADRARQFIRQGMALAEAAAASGFADQSHMTRIFVGKYGVTPGVYAAAFR
jgi:AraC-like DNA-binding protein